MYRAPVWLLAAILLTASATVPVAASDEDDCVESGGNWNDATKQCVGGAPERDELPDECKDGEVYNENTTRCEDVPEVEDADGSEDCDAAKERWNATAGECEDLPEADDECVETENEWEEETLLDNGTVLREKYKEETKDCPGTEDDESEVEREVEYEEADADDLDEACVESETEYEHEERLDNGTRYKEKVEEKTWDCPGTENDRTEVEREVEWDEDSSGRGRGAEARSDVRIERRGDDVRIEMKVKEREERGRGANVTMRDNASVMELARPDGRGKAFEVAFLEVLEFEDTDGGGAFDLDDRVLNAWRVADLPVNATNGEDALWIVYDLPPGGTLAFAHRETDDGRAKFDIVFEGFAYATSASRLALRAAFEAENAAYREDLGDPALVAQVGGLLATFDWIRTVEVDGVEMPVEATVYVGGAGADGTAQLYLAYPRGDSIVHDPSVGYVVQSAAAVAVDVLLHPAAYAAAALGAALFVGLGYAARKRN